MLRDLWRLFAFPFVTVLYFWAYNAFLVSEEMHRPRITLRKAAKHQFDELFV